MDCVLFRCHNQSKTTLENLRLISEQSPFDVYVVYDCTDKKPLKSNGVQVFNFSLDDYFGLNYKLVSEKQMSEIPTPPTNKKIFPLYYNPEYASIMFSKLYPEYDNYWYIEYDVFFNGNWKDFFAKFEQAKEDFLCVDLCQYPFTWWGDIKKTHLPIDIPEENIFRFFGCINRVSKRLLDVLDYEYSQGKHGFYELTIASFASLHGLTMADLNKYGLVWTPYTVGGVNLMKTWTQPIVDKCKDLLFHPIR